MMPESDAADRVETPQEEYLRGMAKNLRTITGLFLEFFENDGKSGRSCLASIDESLKKLADSLDTLTGVAGFSNRIQRIQDALEYQARHLDSLQETITLLQVRDRPGSRAKGS